MKRSLLIISLIICALTTAKAQYYSVNYDQETVAKMVASFNTEAATEMYYADQIAKIREHYQAAEVAAAGIFTSKFLDRKALTDLGLWTSSCLKVHRMPYIGVPTSIRSVTRQRICAINSSLSSPTVALVSRTLLFLKSTKSLGTF